MYIDLRSDTVTKPTDEMRKIMAHAEVGDDVYREDSSILKLEAMSAEMMGKEAALFVPSGTMGNQLAVLSHCARGEELICEADSHVFYLEKGAAAVLAGVQIRPLPPNQGLVTAEELDKSWRGSDIHYPEARLVWVENTHNRAGGVAYPMETLHEVKKWAENKHLATHMDGARIFNAALALGVPVKEIAETVDTVMFCISKGLGCPVGSLLVGSKDFIERSRQWRKMLGGGMRQAGILAAAGIYALENRMNRLQEDHDFAKELSAELLKIGYTLPAGVAQTNILMVESPEGFENAQTFTEALKKEGILASAFGPKVIRLVTHQDVSIKSLPTIMEVFKKLQEV